MTDILLIQPPIRDFYLTAKRTIPYGLASIAAKLEQANFSVEIIDSLATKKSRIIPLPSEMAYLKQFYPQVDVSPFSLFHHYRHYGYSYQHIAARIAASGASLVGISSLFTPYAEDALKIAELVKQSLPASKVVMGGHHPTCFPLDVLRHPAVDFVVRGEGEASFHLLAKALKEKVSIASVPGICFYDKQHKPVIKKPALMKNVSANPPPSLRLISQKFYQRNKRGSSVIMAGRGCSMKCSYCSVSRNSYLTYRLRSVESVLEEMDRAINQYQVQFIDFEDENLSVNQRWFHELLEGIIERFGPKELELRAMNGLLPSTLDDRLIKKMKQAGFKTLNLSLCTTFKPQLKRFSRPDVRTGFETVLGLAARYGMSCTGYIIVGAPNQDPGESVDDLLYLADKRVLVGVSIFYPSPGSSDYDYCSNKGLLPESFSLMRSTALPISDTTSREEAITLLRLGRVLNYMKSLLSVGNRNRLNQKTAMGKQLLDTFLEDGQIRGINESGEIYEHAVSTKLTRRFIQGLKEIDIQGAD